MYMYIYMSPTRGSFFTALGVLCCFALFVCLTLLASFFLPSHLSFKHMYVHVNVLACVHVHTHCTDQPQGIKRLCFNAFSDFFSVSVHVQCSVGIA